MLFTGNQPPCRLGIIRHQSRFLATWHVKGNFWCAHTLPRLLQEKQLCVQLGDCSYNSVIMWHIWMVALPKALLQGEEVLLAARGEPCPMSCGGTGWCTSTIHHLKPEWSASTVLHPGASATQRILLPEYPTPAARVQRYMEFAGRNTTKWNHCIWKCVFSCPKSSVHKQNCKGYMYKP